MKIELISSVVDPRALISRAARRCRGVEAPLPGENQDAYIEALIQAGHLSVLEHCYATFEIKGISRACLAQFTRHRHLSFSVESLRVRPKNPLEFVGPDDLTPEQSREMAVAFGKAADTYAALRAKGVSPENARAVLPLATATNLIVTGNYRAWYEFIGKRWQSNAQREIRQMAEGIWEKLNDECPPVFGGLTG